MRILIVHNHYGEYATGGEAHVMCSEANLLNDHGHTVKKYECTNAEITKDATKFNMVMHFANIGWSDLSYHRIKMVIKDFNPDIMHIHNYWFLLTPSVFAAAKDCGVKIVHTLHNYRLICPAGQLLRQNSICEKCIKGHPYRVLWNNCLETDNIFKAYLKLKIYLKTRSMNYLHDHVDAFIALSEFGRSKFIEGGVDDSKIFVKSNFMSDPFAGEQSTGKKIGAVFTGRLSPEKGIITLIKAWESQSMDLFVIGEGPMEDKLKESAPSNVHFIGKKSHSDTIEYVKKAQIFIFPSEWYEGFPLSLLEAMAVGVPIIASDLGPRNEMIEHKKTGLLFEPGNVKDLNEKIYYLNSNEQNAKNMGKEARRKFLTTYSDEVNYKELLNIYKNALKSN